MRSDMANTRLAAISRPPMAASVWCASGAVCGGDDIAVASPESRPLAEPSRLDGRSADVAVVGAGITGLVTAVLLARAGKDVLVLKPAPPAR